jgi:chaperone required for assembly of F1-ATPase
MTAAQQKARPEFPKRFYKQAGFAKSGDGYAIQLDGKQARTPGRAPLVVSSERLAEALAAEWEAQVNVIDPRTMPLTRIVNSAVDGVTTRMDEVRAGIVAYAGTDLLCYWAESPDALVARQAAAWSPLLDWAKTELGARFAKSQGIAHVAQEPETLAAIDRALMGYDPIALAALHTITTLTGSAILALAVAKGRLTPAQAWSAAHIDEDWQVEKWGEDFEAAERRAARWKEMAAAGLILAN